MRNLYYKKIWLSIGITLVIVVLALSFISTPESTKKVLYIDHFVHGFLYLTLSWYFSQIYNTTKKNRIFWAFFFMGTLIEIFQPFTGYRSFQYLDILGNTVGNFLGLAITLFLFPTVIETIDHKIKKSLN